MITALYTGVKITPQKSLTFSQAKQRSQPVDNSPEELMEEMRREGDFYNLLDTYPDTISLRHYKQLNRVSSLGKARPLFSDVILRKFDSKRLIMLISKSGSRLTNEAAKALGQQFSEWRCYGIFSKDPITPRVTGLLREYDARISDLPSITGIVKFVQGKRYNSEQPNVRNAYVIRRNRFRRKSDQQKFVSHLPTLEVPKNMNHPFKEGLQHYIHSLGELSLRAPKKTIWVPDEKTSVVFDLKPRSTKTKT